MGNVNIEEADALNILGMKISCDAGWNDHIFRVAKQAFNCFGFLKRCRNYFTPSDLITFPGPLSVLEWSTTVMYWPVLQGLF